MWSVPMIGRRKRVKVWEGQSRKDAASSVSSEFEPESTRPDGTANESLLYRLYLHNRVLIRIRGAMLCLRAGMGYAKVENANVKRKL